MISQLPAARQALEQAILEYEAHIGAFLQTGAEISTLRSRAAAYAESKDTVVAARAQAVVQQANGALAQFQEIQTTALQAASQAGQLKSQMDRDPQWKALLEADSSSLGWATLQAIGSKARQVGAVAASLAGVEARIVEHLKKTMPALRSSVKGVEDLAQGKGISGAAHSLSSSLAAQLKGAVDGASSALGLEGFGKWAAIGGAVLVLGPYALQGLVAAFAPRPLRNPRRRRRARRRS